MFTCWQPAARSSQAPEDSNATFNATNRPLGLAFTNALDNSLTASTTTTLLSLLLALSSLARALPPSSFLSLHIPSAACDADTCHRQLLAQGSAANKTAPTYHWFLPLLDIYRANRALKGNTPSGPPIPLLPLLAYQLDMVLAPAHAVLGRSPFQKTVL